MLCPSALIRGTEKVNDFIGAVNTSNKDQAPLNRLSEGRCARWNDTDVLPATPERIAEVQQLLEDGYGTNYAAGWFLVRSGAKTTNATDHGQRTTDTRCLIWETDCDERVLHPQGTVLRLDQTPGVFCFCPLSVVRCPLQMGCVVETAGTLSPCAPTIP